MNKILRLIIVLLSACSPVLAQTVISNVYVQSSTATTATIVWTTTTASSSQIKYGFSSGSLIFSNNTNFSLVTSHSMTLPLLNPSQPYFFAVVSTDNSGIPTTSATKSFALCGQPFVPVSGTVNFAYGNGSFTLTYNPPSGSSGPYTICSQSLTSPVTGTLNTSGSFNAVVADALKVTPGPGTWTIAINGAGSIGAISINSTLSSQTQDVSSQLQTAAVSVGLTPVTATASTCNPAWVCSAGGSVINPGATYALPAYPLASGKTLSPSNIGVDITGNNLLLPSGGTITIPGCSGKVVGADGTGCLSVITAVNPGTGLSGGGGSGSVTLTCTTATAGTLGCSRPDGTTITASAGVLTAVSTGTVTGQASGVIPLGGGAAVINAQSHLDDGVTTAATITSSEPLAGTNATMSGFLKAQSIGSLLYSAQYGTGLIGAMATGKTVVTGTDDAITATNYSFSNMIPNVPSNFAWTDYRKNAQGQMNFFHNWGYTRAASFSAGPDAFQINCLDDQPWVGGTGNTLYACSHMTFFDSSPGISLGNPAVNNALGNWQTGHGMLINFTSNGAGIRQSQDIGLNHYGIGDTAWYSRLFSHGGSKAGSDEGVEFASAVTEESVQATGTCATGCTTGSTQFTLTMSTGAGTQGVGRSIINTTVGPQANTITNVAAGLGSGIEAVTLGTPVTQSVAWGTLVANVLPTFGDLASPPFGTVKTFSVNVTSGTFDTTHVFCFADQFNDQTIPTAVSGGGPVSITALVHRPHGAGARVFQGGLCGYGGEQVIYTNGGNRYLFNFVGSTSTTVGQATSFRFAAASTAPFSVYGYQLGNIGGISSNGTTVYVKGITAGTFATPLLTFNKNTFVISNASDSALNAACTNWQWVNALTSAATCTIAGLTGQHTATTANFQPALINGTPANTLNIWPMQEVLDVQNETLTPPSVDGSFTTMAGTMPISVGDTLVELNSDAGVFTGYRNNVSVTNPLAQMFGMYINMSGTGMAGGSTSQASNTAMRIVNSAGDTTYFDAGGSYSPPNILNYAGAYQSGFMFDHGPASNSSLFSLIPTTVQKNNPEYGYSVLSLANKSGTSFLSHNPFSGDMTLFANGQLNLFGSGANIHFGSNSDAITFSDRITFSVLTTPVIASVVQGPGAGTLADGTYCYRLYYRNNAGTGPASAEVCGAVANGGANSVQINLPRNGGVILLNLCGRTTGAELLMSPGPALNSTIFIDDGSITPSGGSCSGVADTTRGFVDQAATLNMNSSGTAFTANLKAPASAAATYVETLPETATVGSLVDKLAGATVVGDLATFSNITGRIQDGGTFTSLLTTPLASPPAIGGTTPAAGSFTTLKGTTINTTTNCAVNSVSPAACGSAAAGAVVIPTTTTTYTVNTSAVTANSVILFTPRTYTGNLPSTPTCVAPAVTSAPVVSAIVAATSFTITLPSTTGQTCWNYSVID